MVVQKFQFVTTTELFLFFVINLIEHPEVIAFLFSFPSAFPHCVVTNLPISYFSEVMRHGQFRTL